MTYWDLSGLFIPSLPFPIRVHPRFYSGPLSPYLRNNHIITVKITLIKMHVATGK